MKLSFDLRWRHRGVGLRAAARRAVVLAGALVAAGWPAAGDVASPDFAAAAKVLSEAVEDRAFPGCTVAVGTAEGPLWTAAFGRQDYQAGPAVADDTIYDLASLTKVVGTTTVVAVLVRDGKLSLDDPLEKYLPQFVARAPAAERPGVDERRRRRRVTMEHLLTHSSGLPAGRPLFKTCDSYAKVLEGALAVPLAAEPGERAVYSDLGYMLLGEAAARAGGKPLCDLERTLVFAPLGMKTTLRNPAPSLRTRIAPTETDPAQPNRFLRGVVHDENARAGEGLTGHAGLFSTAEDVGRLAQEWLRALAGAGRLLPRPLALSFVRGRELVKGSSRALGWDTPSGQSSAGALLSRQSFGHTGFTGTSLWIDPDRRLYVVLLANRVHPTRANGKIHAVRRALADSVAKAVDAVRPPSPSERNVPSPQSIAEPK